MFGQVKIEVIQKISLKIFWRFFWLRLLSFCLNRNKQLTFGGNLKSDKKLLKFNNVKILSNTSLQLSPPNLYTCSTVTFRTTLWETTLHLHLLSLIIKTCPKKKVVLQPMLVLLVLLQLTNTSGFLAQF